MACPRFRSPLYFSVSTLLKCKRVAAAITGSCSSWYAKCARFRILLINWYYYRHRLRQNRFCMERHRRTLSIHRSIDPTSTADRSTVKGATSVRQDGCRCRLMGPASYLVPALNSSRFHRSVLRCGRDQSTVVIVDAVSLSNSSNNSNKNGIDSCDKAQEWQEHGHVAWSWTSPHCMTSKL